MIYPPAPWQLQGYALQTLNLINRDRARPFIPAELEIVSILPGRTLGGVYLSAYQSGSILEYNELIVVPGFVRYGGKVGACISHIYVDSEKSVAGGREIWGLPKEMAEFSWEEDRVTVRKEGKDLCCLRYQKGFLSLLPAWKQQFSGQSFGGLGTEILFFDSQFESQMSFAKGYLEIPSNSPFNSLNLGQPFVSLNLRSLKLTANAPAIIGKKFT